MTPSRQEIVDFLQALRDEIIAAFEALEPRHRFERTGWSYQKGYGGGQMSVIRGDVFEKAAVNWSGVGGDAFPMDDGQGAFFATGISLITHMRNPYAPTVHMNIRYLETEKQGYWLGGGYDLTPMGKAFEEDREHFHHIAKQALDAHSPGLYEQFSENARKYFYIPHRQRERGVGGIFFDHYRTSHFDRDLAMWKNVGKTFLDAIVPIYERRIQMTYPEEERQEQLRRRAHYAEFNLLYDRGTKFGFLSGGNPEAILCSMPPLASW